MKKLLFVFCCIVCIQKISAQIKLPTFVADSMILQRDTKVPIWGWCAANKKITIQINKQSYTANSDSSGKWKVELKPIKAGGPYTIQLTQDAHSVTLKDVYFGDVWLCSGQSNMELEMARVQHNYKADIEQANNPLIRHFKVKRRFQPTLTNDLENDGGWQTANPSSILKFSAPAYFFANELYNKYKVPIGLINATYGGSTIQSWMNEATLKQFPAYYEKALQYNNYDSITTITARNKSLTADWVKAINACDLGYKENWSNGNSTSTEWKSIEMPRLWKDEEFQQMNGAVWFKKEFTLTEADISSDAILSLGRLIDEDITYLNGVKIGATPNAYMDRFYTVAKSLLKVGTNTLVIRLLNYEGRGGFVPDKLYSLVTKTANINLYGEWKFNIGCSQKAFNKSKFVNYAHIGNTMYYSMMAPLVGYAIKGFTWYQGESNVVDTLAYQQMFTAYIQQIRSLWNNPQMPFLYVQISNYLQQKKYPSESRIAQLQQAQLNCLNIPKTAMVVTNDIGEWNDIHPANKKDVGKRLALAALHVAYGEKNVVYSGPEVEGFTIHNDSIIVSFKHIGSGLIAKGADSLQYFAIAGENQQFVWAKAIIRNNTVVVWGNSVKQPKIVRYAWADNPFGANLYNKEGLPASCFDTRYINKK